jgi:hypothetical protein
MCGKGLKIGNFGQKYVIFSKIIELKSNSQVLTLSLVHFVTPLQLKKKYNSLLTSLKAIQTTA